jgi:hypothetical protein
VIVDAFLILVGEFAVPHASEVAATAARRITHGPHARKFWGGAIVGGHLLPLGLLALDASGAGIAAAALVMVGLYLYEHAFVMAPQEVPNS